MTLEAALLAAISAVTSALVIVCQKLWQRSEACEKQHREMQIEVERLKSELGLATGTLRFYERCPVPNCPWRSTTTGIQGAPPSHPIQHGA